MGSVSKVLWIIGNGFDKNLGLNTGYRSFLLNKYFAPGAENKYRDELVRRLGKFEPESQSDLWSDLESRWVRSPNFTRTMSSYFTIRLRIFSISS